MTKLHKLQPIGIAGVPIEASWGRPGATSLVGRLAARGEGQRRWAELWFGTHVKAPSPVLEAVGRGGTLAQLLTRQPELLGASRGQWGEGLPFLFKVLSIDHLLSIQVHPDRMTAVQLHERDPDNYPDPNHKPEAAIAITPVELFYGFLPAAALRNNFRLHTELRILLGAERYDYVVEGGEIDSTHRRELFTAICGAAPNLLQEATKEILKRAPDTFQQDMVGRWFWRSAQQYPQGDCGLFCLLFMNFVTLLPGEAIAIAPRMLHAYASGDLVECMANSDNVVRCGLTPKKRDVDVLTALLDYEETMVFPLQPQLKAPGELHYDLPIEEFQLGALLAGAQLEYVAKEAELLVSVDGCGIITPTGSGSRMFQAGDAFFVPASARYALNIDRGTVYRATAAI